MVLNDVFDLEIDREERPELAITLGAPTSGVERLETLFELVPQALTKKAPIAPHAARSLSGATASTR